MLPRMHSRGPFVAVAVVVLATLAGCSMRPLSDVTGPAPTSAPLAAAAQHSPIVNDPPNAPLDAWELPVIRVWTDDGWRVFQKEGGITFMERRIQNYYASEGQTVTFHWSARTKTGRTRLVGTRWVFGLEDITDETPRSGPDDVGHWSTWSDEVTSATVGPLVVASETTPRPFFNVEARDNLGRITLIPIRVTVSPATEAAPVRSR